MGEGGLSLAGLVLLALRSHDRNRLLGVADRRSVSVEPTIDTGCAIWQRVEP